MYTSGSSNRRTYAAGKSEFTEHAAGHILKRVSPFVLLVRHIHDADHPLLNEVKNTGYNTIGRLIKSTFPHCNIQQIRQVYAPQMYGMYLLHKAELLKMRGIVQEKLLYHVTTESKALESLNSGLDWRRTRRSKFGCGVSFSDDIDYANYYANNSSSEDKRVIMICCVMVGETHVVPKQKYAGNSLVVPPGRADTTVSRNGRVHVKYNDYEFYPLYFVYYRRRPEHLTNSKYFRANNRWAQSQMQLVHSLGAMSISN